MKAGENKPWDDKRVRQAVNFAINRQQIIDKVYDGFGEYSGHVAAGLRPVAADPQAELKTKYEKFDLPKAEDADGGRPASRRASTSTMSTFSTPLDFRRGRGADQVAARRRSTSTSTSWPQEPGTFAANNGAGEFDWDLTARGMRGDVDGYVAEFNPACARVYKIWYPRATRT